MRVAQRDYLHPHPEEARSAVSKDERQPPNSLPSFETAPAALLRMKLREFAKAVCSVTSAAQCSATIGEKNLRQSRGLARQPMIPSRAVDFCMSEKRLQSRFLRGRPLCSCLNISPEL